MIEICGVTYFLLFGLRNSQDVCVTIMTCTYVDLIKNVYLAQPKGFMKEEKITYDMLSEEVIF